MPTICKAAASPISTAPRWRTGTAQKFVPGSERLRVYNPILEQHGWHSDHTVIEIVNDDMPFLVDSVSMAVNRLARAAFGAAPGIPHLARSRRRHRARRRGRRDARRRQSQLASFIHFEVDRCGDAALLNTLRNDIAHVLGDVRASVEDWPKIVEIARATIKEMKARESTAEDIEARAFLEWMVADHFTFLGQRDYALVSDGTGFGLRAHRRHWLRHPARIAARRARRRDAAAAGRRRHHHRLLADLPDQGEFARNRTPAAISTTSA